MSENIKDKFYVVHAERVSGWNRVYEMAKGTSGTAARREPSEDWKRRILDAGHSPIEALTFNLTFVDIPTFVSVHLVRHKIGVTHFVQSQRPDRSATHIPRHELRQDAPVTHRMFINAQAILTISRRRLCFCASPETQAAWASAVAALYDIGETALARACVPMCAYRGGICHEMKGCGLCPDVEEAADWERQGYPPGARPESLRDPKTGLFIRVATARFYREEAGK